MLTLQTRRYSVIYPRLAPRLLLRPENPTPTAFMRTILRLPPSHTNLEDPFTRSSNYGTTVT